MSAGMNIWAKRILWLLVALAAVGGLVWAFSPRPVPVDVGVVARGELTVTVSEDGRTRVIDRYTVSAPLTGQLERIRLDEGERVRKGQTVARIAPVAPPLLDVRTREEAEARVAASQAALSRARAAQSRARETYQLARSEARRHQQLFEGGVATGQATERARSEARTAAADLESARFSVAVAQSDLEVARTALRTITGEAPQEDADVLEVSSPVDSQVLQVVQESEGVVQTGTPLVELGQLDSLEVVIDVLTADAVAVEPGQSVRLVRWGGDRVLSGRVERVDPSAFTEVSSLGVEEQRVNIIVRLTSPRGEWRDLGDGYRVEADIVTWQKPDILQVDASSVFRARGGWAVYRVVDGRAELTPVEIGRRTERRVQILDGLEPGERVVLYPTDAVADGVRLEPRES